MSDIVPGTCLRVLVLSSNTLAALVMVRCLQTLGHAAESCADVAAAEALWRTGAWDALVLDLDALSDGALDALGTLAPSAPAGRPCMLLGAASTTDPLDTLGLAAAGLDRFVPAACEVAEWRRALDARLPPGVDPQALASLRELDAGVGRDSARVLLKDAPRKLEALRSGLLGRDFDAARRAAHSLKGSAAQLGALRVAGLCAQLEEQLARDDEAAAAATCERLAAAWHAAEPWFASEAER